jgi:hypothetical protein
MKVKVRHIDDWPAKPFCEIGFDQIPQLLSVISIRGGIVYEGEYYTASPEIRYDIDEPEVYLELLLHKDD